jgi:hypothetical protein
VRGFRLALAAVVLVVGCEAPSRPPTSVSDGVLTATARASALRLRNSSSQAVNYFVLASDAVPLVDWLPCAGPACPAIPAGGSVSLPYSQIAGYSASTTEAIVWWWHSVSDGAGGYQPDSLRTLLAPL